MPKPFPHFTGNGCHVHLSVWDVSGAVGTGDLQVHRRLVNSFGPWVRNRRTAGRRCSRSNGQNHRSQPVIFGKSAGSADGRPGLEWAAIYRRAGSFLTNTSPKTWGIHLWMIKANDRRRDPHDLLAMIETWIRCDVSDNPLYKGDYPSTLRGMRARTLVMAGQTDLYFTPADCRAEVEHIPQAIPCRLHTGGSSTMAFALASSLPRWGGASCYNKD